ncbi:MAG: oligosaccharide repeat unit polymerase, partial [Lachnospiraceae bacterium]
MRTDDNPIIYLIYGQIAVYLALSFFTTWFSNPTTWFWLVLTVMMYLFVGYQKKEKQVL